MTKSNLPELNFKERITRDVILPYLPDDWSEYDDIDDEDLQLAQSILAQEYVKHGSISGLMKIFSLIGFYDILFHSPIQVYGLVLSAYGSIFLSVPALHTPKSLAGDTISEAESLEAAIRSGAERAVKTNIGIVYLLIGFILQIFAVVNRTRPELLRENWAVGVISSWHGFLLLFIATDLLIDGPIRGTLRSILSRIT